MVQRSAMPSRVGALALSANAWSTGSRSDSSTASAGPATAVHANRTANARQNQVDINSISARGRAAGRIPDYPVEVAGRPADDFDRQHFRQFIRMQGGDKRSQRFDLIARGLDQQQELVRAFGRALPAIDRTHARKDVDAGRQACGYQGIG